MPPALIEELDTKKVEQAEYTTLDACLPETDVLYVTRVQKERFTEDAVYESVKGAYVINPKVLKVAKERMIVMHPLHVSVRFPWKWMMIHARLISGKWNMVYTLEWPCWRWCWEKRKWKPSSLF